VQPGGSGFKDFLLPAVSLAGEASPVDNSPTHGTSMLETILRGLAQVPASADGTPVRILPVDVYGNSTTTSTYDVARGIYEAVNGGAQIVNLSLGSSGDSQFLHNIIKQGYDQGVLFVAAAGNMSTDAPTYPAAYPEVLAVTAGDKKGNIASYANYGSFVDAVGPSSTIVYFNGKAYFVSGTSASTAYISGLAAGLANSTGKKPTEVVPQIMQVFGVKPTTK
jgi:thermitase